MPETGSEITTINCVDPTHLPGWDHAAADLGGSVFHSIGWANVLRRSYGYRADYFVGRDASSTIQAVWPVMEVASWATGKRGIALPFTDECAPSGVDTATLRQMFRAIIDHGRTRGWKYFECRGTEVPAEGATPSLSFYSHQLNLQRTEAELLAGVESSGRRAIRKAQESGVVVEFATDAAAMDAFYRLVCRTRKRHGLPPQPLRFYQHIQQELIGGGKGSIALARYKGQTVAGAVYLHSSRTALYKFGASDEAFQQYRGNNLVMWEAIRRYARDGFAALDFGRTSLGNAGLRKFKLGWGTAEHTAHYYKFDFRQNAFVTDSDRSSGWHSRVFGSLPGPVARIAGQLLYKHIA